MGEVVFAPTRSMREAAGEVKKKKRRRKTAPTSAIKDPRIKIENRTFELVRCYPLGGGDSIIERRLRLRVIGKGGLEDEVYQVGDLQCYVGLVSEQLTGRDKWSPYTWGHIPVSGTDWVREIVNDTPPVEAQKKEAKTDGV